MARAAMPVRSGPTLPPSVPSLWQWMHPVLENDPDLARWAVDVLREEQLVVDPIPRLNFGAEDFAHYCEKVPGLFMFLGTNNPAKGITAVNHSSRFDIDEDVLELGVRAYVALVTDYLEED